MNAGILKRLGALAIDFLIVIFIANLFTRFLPNNNELIEANNEMTKFLMENQDVLKSNDKEKVEVFSSTLSDFGYEISKLSIWTNLLKTVIYFLYFVVFQSYNNGQTVGKKLLKIEIVDDEGNPPKFKKMFIRGIILYPIIFNILDVAFVSILSKAIYLNVSNILAYLQYGLYFVCFITVIISGRGIHDKIVGTSVVKFGTFDTVEESQVSKWKKTALKEKESKKYRVNHTSGKRKE